MPADAATRRPALSLNADISLAKAAKAFARTGVAVIENALDFEGAAALASAMIAAPGFNLVTRIENQHRDFDAAAMAALAPDQRARFEQLVADEARAGFQYLYETYALYDAGREGRAPPPAFKGALDLVRSREFLGFARKVCWNEQIRFADAQLTRFQAGHFLSQHDDDIPEKRRVAAYVLQLCSDWRADFGGVLNLLTPDGEVRRGLVPGFNRLILFSVPRPHAVSAVAPFAPRPRLAMTGWLREGEPG
ncbi:2OG-Fe(II) oxygenase [Maricaulaceae bacterium MS644]